MNNTVLPYTVHTDSSEESDDSDSSEEGNLLTNNLGVVNNKFETKDVRFMDQEKAEDYQQNRNQLFTPEISKIRILVDSKNITHTTTSHDTSNYTVQLNGNDTTNSTSGFGNYNNVIGFRLIKAIVANSFYRVNDNNNIINFMHGGSLHTATLTPGAYTFSELATEIKNQMNTAVSLSIFTITSDSATLKYTITSSSGGFYFQKSNSWRLLGLFNMDESADAADTTRVLPNVVDHSIHFVDLVIPEIPYIACKHNMSSKHIIDRIPLDEPAGDMVSYINTSDSFMNYFYPINLSKLTIQLYEDTNNDFYDCQNADNSFEFEIALLNK